MNKTYEKIKNVLSFGSAKDKTITFTKEFEFLKDLKYYATEKLDGTNIRLYYDGYNLSMHGRTEKSELPLNYEKEFYEKYDKEVLNSKLEELFGAKEVIIYGEGIGKKIQNNGEKYIEDGTDFVVFDILVNGTFLERENVVDISQKLGLKVVEVVAYDKTLVEIIQLVNTHLSSKYNANHEMEGLVCKPLIPLFFKDGTRVCFKVKYQDLVKLEKQVKNSEVKL